MKKFLIIIFILLTSLTSFSQLLHHSTSREDLISKLIFFSYSKYGSKYVYGANGTNDIFDCSSFTMRMFEQIGIKLARTSRQQINNGIRIEKHKLEPGDLVFFSGRKISKRIGHVGIVVKAYNESEEFSFIHAACHGVTVSHSNEAYYRKRYIGACRINF